MLFRKVTTMRLTELISALSQEGDYTTERK